MKKFLKISGIAILVLVAFAIISAIVMHDERPTGTESEVAEKLVDRMWTSLNKDAYDSTRYISWKFAGIHHWFWDKELNLVRGVWGDVDVVFNADQPEQNKVVVNGKPLKGAEAMDEVRKARDMFYNDSFWLIAPFKARDPGTSRKLVNSNDGQGVLVEYSSGGATPGDAYLWHLDDEGRPKDFQMWVSIIPIGGIKAEWKDWKEMDTGFEIAENRGLGFMELKIDDIRAGNSPESIGFEGNELQIIDNQ